MTRVHFEIGHIINDEGETMSVFSADTLSECIKEFKHQRYDLEKYFIDVWETDNEGTPYPIADIKIEDWIFKNEGEYNAYQS